jgi:DNA topoisomerase-1
MGFKLFLEAEAKKQKEYSEAELEARQKKKTTAINTLAKNLSKLNSKVTKDLSSDDEKTQLTALAIALINDTKERIGNDRSANGIRKDMETGKDVKGDPHYGVTGWKKKHIKFSNGTATIKYVGKSGVDQEKKVKNSKIVSVLKKFADMNDNVFTTSDGVKIGAKQVNSYLGDFDITAKDLRGFGANELIIKELKKSKAPADEKERKKHFLDVATKVAERLGHSPTMLRNSYLLPDLEEMYLKSGKVKEL